MSKYFVLMVLAVLQEAMRFKPVASTGTTRKAKQALRLGGYAIPAGTLLLVPFDPVHRCNFERPDDFWPVRLTSMPALFT